ncbi:DUF1127 domain-containing protein [Pseudorhodoplanes sp.]|uniref:DUF1127 domain-containing protein n=1 Tax=Pseudorhodoplanes sp. TaxID=1934341 RepID=UPI002BFB97FE|nr:DUF1127 domain-containing protein [Pseudorhodoplanes sp.]HWV52086.1 DUF1127 domain-containing protein [Pseudorhodoplanes sp.]
MTSNTNIVFAPRTFAQACTLRTRMLARQVHVLARLAAQGFRNLRARIARAAQYRRELEQLMHADQRMLADIGLTRYDVINAVEENRGWLNRRDALQAVATRREDAMAVAAARRIGLPRVDAPSIEPTLPHTMEMSKFS